MSTGLEAGITEIRKGMGPDRVTHMVLLTDGQTWGDEDQCRALAQQLGGEGVRLTALGLGDEWNEQLLDDLAAATNGTSDYIADPKDIAKYFQAATVGGAKHRRTERPFVAASGAGCQSTRGVPRNPFDRESWL